MSYQQKAPMALALVGNPGSGKSTLLNGLADKIAFQSGVSIGGGLTTLLQKHEGDGYTLFDTPGLSDAERRKQAGVELDKLLSEKSDIKIAFVVTLEHGRVRPADAATIDLVLSAIQIDTTGKFGVIINQMTKGVRRELERDAKGEAVMRRTLVGNRQTPFWCYLDCVPDLIDEKNGMFKPPQLTDFLLALPVAKPVSAEVIKIDTSSMEIKLEIQAERIKQLEKANEMERERMKEEMQEQKKLLEQQQRRIYDLENPPCCIQ